VKRFFIIQICSLVAIAGFSTARGDDSNQKYIEIDARGPVHEAYAQPYASDPVPNSAVDKQPPDPIPEEPAAERPTGKNVQWIPGYWQWDNDRKDFIWNSGMWREMPQGRRWVPGYWAKTAEGFRWVSGHFADANEKDNQYVPEPPRNPDQGPTTPAPDDNSSYIPGAWFYGNNGYTYRGGYWTDCFADRIWIPARYYWSPYGYRFCSGYWDYPFAGRGLLFAPVYFTRPLWLTTGWFYRPYFTVGFGGLFGNFFVGYGYNHYFFGDYYGSSYLSLGIYPWYWGARYRYDPIWNHQRSVNRNNANWATTFHNNYIGRVNGTMPIPPRSLSSQAALGATAAGTTPRMINSLAEAKQSGLKLETVTPQQRTVQMQAAKQMVTQSQQLSRAAPNISTSNYGNAAMNSTPRSVGSSSNLSSGSNRAAPVIQGGSGGPVIHYGGQSGGSSSGIQLGNSTMQGGSRGSSAIQGGSRGYSGGGSFGGSSGGGMRGGGGGGSHGGGHR
jgi:hypothetical protein